MSKIFWHKLKLFHFAKNVLANFGPNDLHVKNETPLWGTYKHMEHQWGMSKYLTNINIPPGYGDKDFGCKGVNLASHLYLLRSVNKGNHENCKLCKIFLGVSSCVLGVEIPQNIYLLISLFYNLYQAIGKHFIYFIYVSVT